MRNSFFNLMTVFSKLAHLFAGFVCLLAALALLIQAGLPERANYTGFFSADMAYTAPEIGSMAPPFTLLTPNLDSFALAQVQGNITILNFWATWCLPCRAEMQELQNLHRSHPARIRILGINSGESPELVAQWTEELGLTFDILLDPLQSAARLYQIRGLPTTYLLDSEHRIQNIYFGRVSLEQLTEAIRSIIVDA